MKLSTVPSYLPHECRRCGHFADDLDLGLCATCLTETLKRQEEDSGDDAFLRSIAVTPTRLRALILPMTRDDLERVKLLPAPKR